MQGFHGIWPVLITPYNQRLQIDVEAYREILNWHLSFGPGGLYANCLSSEMFELDEGERLLLIEEAAKVAVGKVPVAATGNFGVTLDNQVEFCKKAADAGADIVMLTLPTDLIDDQDLEVYFFRMAERTDMPLGLYECPYPRKQYLGLDLIEKLAHSGRYFAYKETSCDLDKMVEIIRITRNTPLAFLQANVPFLVDAMRAGAAGSMNVVANWLPDLTIEVTRRTLAGDPSADELHPLLCAMELAQRSVHPTGVKYLMSKRGLPITPLTRYRQQMSKEEAKALDLVSELWFRPDGSLKILPATTQVSSAKLV